MHHRQNHLESTCTTGMETEGLKIQLEGALSHVNFLMRCISQDIIPKGLPTSHRTSEIV
jgi:hypothetical protein